jgi:signal transduction histidine kinase
MLLRRDPGQGHKADRLAIAIDNSRLYTELRTSDRLKDEFLATMSHELRTPLTAILGWTRMLKAGTLPGEKKVQAVEVIDRNAEFESRLVDDILDASRMISGTFTIDYESVNLAEVLQSAIDFIRPSSNAKNLTLITQFQGAALVRGSAKRLQQIFGNLLANSVKFTPPQAPSRSR